MDIDIFSCASVYPAYLSVRMRREGRFEGPCRVHEECMLAWKVASRLARFLVTIAQSKVTLEPHELGPKKIAASFVVARVPSL